MSICTTPEDIQVALDSMLIMLGINIQADGPLSCQTSKDSQIRLIDSFTEALHVIQSTLTTLIDNRISSLKRHRNAISSPLDQLPVELLQIVIEKALDGVGVEKRPRRLEEMRTVSATWSARLLACPTLWATVDVSIPSYRHERDMMKVQRLLARSKNAPLTISTDGFDGRLMETFAQHASRWRSLSIEYPTPQIQSSLSLPAPMLEELIFQVRARRGTLPFAGFKSLLGGYAPCLRSIRSSYLEILEDANPKIFKQVVRLALAKDDTMSGTRSFFERASRIAALCPVLESLEITLQDTAPDRVELRIREPITLYTVHSYRLCLPLSLLPNAINNLHVPHCTDFHIHNDTKRHYPPLTSVHTQLDALFKGIAPLLGNGSVTAKIGTSRPQNQYWEIDMLSLHAAGSATTFHFHNFWESLEVLSIVRSVIKITNLDLHPSCTSRLQKWGREMERLRLPVGRITIKAERHAVELQDLAMLFHFGGLTLEMATYCSPEVFEVWDGAQWVDKVEEVKAYIIANR